MPRKPHEKLPDNPAELLGVTKAAILLVALGQDEAGSVLKQLPAEAVEEVTRELASLGRVPKDLQISVVEEFYHLSIASGHMSEGNLEYARQLLKNSLDPKIAERVTQQIQTQVQKTPFSFLQR